MMVVSTNFFANIAKFFLLAIAFFILAGFLMERLSSQEERQGNVIVEPASLNPF